MAGSQRIAADRLDRLFAPSFEFGGQMVVKEATIPTDLSKIAIPKFNVIKALSLVEMGRFLPILLPTDDRVKNRLQSDSGLIAQTLAYRSTRPATRASRRAARRLLPRGERGRKATTASRLRRRVRGCGQLASRCGSCSGLALP